MFIPVFCCTLRCTQTLEMDGMDFMKECYYDKIISTDSLKERMTDENEMTFIDINAQFLVNVATFGEGSLYLTGCFGL